MQAVQDDNQRKAAELESLRTHLQLPSSQKPVPPPFPSELANYSVQSEQASRGDHQTIVSPIISPRRLPPPLSEEEVMMSSGLMGDVNGGMASNSTMVSLNDMNATMVSLNDMNATMASSNDMNATMVSSNDMNATVVSSNDRITSRYDMKVTTNAMSPSASRPIPSVGSPMKSRAKQPPPMPKKPASLLQEIQEAPSHVHLRKVPK